MLERDTFNCCIIMFKPMANSKILLVDDNFSSDRDFFDLGELGYVPIGDGEMILELKLNQSQCWVMSTVVARTVVEQRVYIAVIAFVIDCSIL